jgi:hypothetical protein
VTQDATRKAPGFMKRPSGIIALISAGLVLVVVLALSVAVLFTSTPAFFARYSGLTRRYEGLRTSVHRNLACGDCHTDGRGPVVNRVALIGDFYRSLFSKQMYPAYVGFAKPTREACLKCHRGAWSFSLVRTTKVPHPAHLRTSTEKRDCVTCHKWTAHEEAYMEKHKTMPFSGVCVSYGCHAGFKPTDQCATCHHALGSDKQWEQKDHPKAVRTIGANACLEKCHEAAQCRMCHTTGKRPVFNGLTAQSGTKAIEVLHAKPDWIQKHGAQALADKSKCLLCHMTDGECKDCHSLRPAFHGSTSTWIGTHKTLGKDKARCLGCHKESWCKACHDQFKEMR